MPIETALPRAATRPGSAAKEPVKETERESAGAKPPRLPLRRLGLYPTASKLGRRVPGALKLRGLVATRANVPSDINSNRLSSPELHRPLSKQYCLMQMFAHLHRFSDHQFVGNSASGDRLQQRLFRARAATAPPPTTASLLPMTTSIQPFYPGGRNHRATEAASKRYAVNSCPWHNPEHQRGLKTLHAVLQCGQGGICFSIRSQVGSAVNDAGKRTWVSIVTHNLARHRGTNGSRWRAGIASAALWRPIDVCTPRNTPVFFRRLSLKNHKKPDISTSTPFRTLRVAAIEVVKRACREKLLISAN